MLRGHRFQAPHPARHVEQPLGRRSDGRTKPPTGPSAGANGARNGCKPSGVGARVGVCRRRQDGGHGAGRQLVGANPGRPAKCASDDQSGPRSSTSGKYANGSALEQHALANTSGGHPPAGLGRCCCRLARHRCRLGCCLRGLCSLDSLGGVAGGDGSLGSVSLRRALGGALHLGAVVPRCSLRNARRHREPPASTARGGA